jgi:hypothetical protein
MYAERRSAQRYALVAAAEPIDSSGGWSVYWMLSNAFFSFVITASGSFA